MIRPVVLVIIDGWGIAPPGPGNAISQSQTPAMNSLIAGFPHTQLLASGTAVGLPQGEDGNTETGHLNIGAGQIVYQDLPRISMSIADGMFFKNPAFINAIKHVHDHHSRLHLIGLVGSGGVHSNIEHLFALMSLAKQNNVSDLFIHAITDGRDSPPQSALTYIAQVKQQISNIGVGKIATVTGRYWSMDRDHRWDRTARAYFCLTQAKGVSANSAEEAVKIAYQKSQTDEFIDPTVILNSSGQPEAVIQANDAVIFFNFRIDRPRQLTKAFVLPDFEIQAKKEGFDPFAVKYYKKHVTDKQSETTPFVRGDKITNLYFVTMTQYEDNLPVDVAFPPQFIQMPLGRVISEKGLRQVRISETEKERFVTYYFNGQRETSFVGEDRVIVPSPKVSTYDLKPEMSTPELTSVCEEKIISGQYDFILVNIACPDMVAHTGNLEATKKACAAADSFINTILPLTLSRGGALVVTADHGNAEELINPVTGGPDTEHSVFPVPFHLATNNLRGKPIQMQSGILADVAPTILKIMEIEKPSSMTGRSLI